MAGFLVITDSSAVAGFMLAGIDCKTLEAGEDISELLATIADEGRYGLVCIEERFLEKVPENVMRRIHKKGVPVVVPITIPQAWEEREPGESPIAKLIRRAIGYQIKIKK